MPPLYDFSDVSLELKQPSLLKKRYVLVAAGEVEIGELDFPSRWGGLATANSGDNCWTFERVGFFRRGAVIRRCGASEDHATFRNKWWTFEGTLVIGEQRYRIAANSRMRRIEILDERERPILYFKTVSFIGSLIRTHEALEIVRSQDDNLVLLILFAWYIISEDSAPIIT